MEDPPEARIIAIGEAVDGADPLFIGSLDAAFEEAWRHGRDWLDGIAIWTEDRIYGAAEIEAMRARRAPS